MTQKHLQFPTGGQSLAALSKGSLLLMVGFALVTQSVPASDLTPPALGLKQAVVSNYAAVVSATYQDSLAAAKSLQSAAASFLAAPSPQTLDAARVAWRAARVPYSQSEAFRFYDGPIDQIDGAINAWPIDENYIDSVAGNPNAGIINAVAQFPVLSRKLILSLNEKEGKKNISTGFHAIEFLLWGQDHNATGPGERSWRDYAPGTKNAERRREYLYVVTDLLVEHIETLARAWAEGSCTNYRAAFVANTDTALAKLLKGMGGLSGPEVAGERLTVPYETKEQEDEQSCFSDNTCDDLVNNAIGLRNVYFGRYASAKRGDREGVGLYDLLKDRDPEFAARLAAQIEAAVGWAKSIPQPFDETILGANATPGRFAVKQAIVAFQTESDMIAQAAKLLSLRLDF